MPLYTFKCPACDKVVDLMIKLADFDEPQYCQCDNKTQLERQISASPVIFNGKWFSNSGSY